LFWCNFIFFRINPETPVINNKKEKLFLQVRRQIQAQVQVQVQVKMKVKLRVRVKMKKKV